MIAATRNAWRLAVGDQSAVDDIDASPSGFWQSLRAAGFCAVPIALYLYLQVAPPEGMAADSPSRWIIEGSGYMLQWTVWPLAMLYLTRAIDRQQHFFCYAVALNYMQIITTGLATTITLILTLTIGREAAAIVGLLLLLASLFLEWMLTRNALNIDGGGAFLIIMINMLLIRLIGGMTDQALVLAAVGAGTG